MRKSTAMGRRARFLISLKQHLSPVAYAKAEAQLNCVGRSKTNDAGFVNTALVKLGELAKGPSISDAAVGAFSSALVFGPLIGGKITHDRMQAALNNTEKELREAVAPLNTTQLKQLDQDFHKRYGKGIEEALLHNNLISPETREALSVYLRHDAKGNFEGSNGRSAAEQEVLANIGIKAKNQDMVAEALRGDTKVAMDGRALFQKDGGDGRLSAAGWRSDLTHLRDIARDGNISLATTTSEDARRSWHFWHTSKDNIAHNVSAATDREREDYRQGRELALANKSPNNPQQAHALEIYKNIHNAFVDAGSPAQAINWEDQLLRKGSLIGALASTHTGFLGTTLAQSHTMNDLLSRVESMNEADWNRLTNKDGKDPTCRRDLEASLRLYTTPDEQARIHSLLDAKTHCKTYQEASTLQRPVLDRIADSIAGKGKGATYDDRSIVDAVVHLSKAEAQLYHDDINFQKRVSTTIQSAALSPEERVLIDRCLAQAKDTGDKPKLGAVEKVLQDQISGTRPIETLKHLDSALADKELRTRLNQPDDKLSAADQDLKYCFKNILKQAVTDKLGTKQ